MVRPVALAGGAVSPSLQSKPVRRRLSRGPAPGNCRASFGALPCARFGLDEPCTTETVRAIVVIEIGTRSRMSVRSRYAAGFSSLLLVVTLTLSGEAAAFKRGQCLEVVGVDRWDFLYIRARPDHRSAKVGAIAPESDSPIVISGSCTPAGAPPKRLWCPIRYYVTKDEVRSGFVKAYYTSEVPCPASLDFYREDRKQEAQ